MPLGPALIAAGGNIAASLLQKKPKTVSPRKTILSTVQGAREAGIHPLAALGAQPQFQTVGGGGSSVGSAIGEGVAQVATAAARQPREDAAAALTRASTEAQLAQAELFRAQSRTIISRAANAAIGGPTEGNSGPPRWDARKQNTTAPMKAFGWDFVPRKGDPSAERAQEWYGELGEWVQAVSNLLRSQGPADALPTDREIGRALKKFIARNRGPANFGPMP